MMISPVIFCTIVLGIGSVRKAAQVGRVGGLALGYFITMSTVALGIGLVVGNIIQPGSGLDITPASPTPAARRRRRRRESTADFILQHHPDDAGLAAGLGHRCCRRCSSRCCSASRCRRWAAPASRPCAASGTSRRSSSASSR